MTLHEIKKNKLRDGGTYKIYYLNQWYYIDFRLDTETPGIVYDGYPEDEGSEIVSDRTIIRQVFKILENAK